MYKIGEFSKINRLTVKTLRHYDETGILKPAQVDECTGYRLYTSDQLPEVQQIVSLKQIGFSLSEIAVILKSYPNETVFRIMLEKKRSEIAKLIDKESQKLKSTENYLHSIEEGISMDYHVTIKDLPEVIVASMRKVIKNYAEFNTLYPKMGELMKKQNLKCINPGYCFTLYHDPEYRSEDIDVEICESVQFAGKAGKGLAFRTIAAVPTAACLYHKGAYETIGRAYAYLAKWIEDNGYQVTDLMREHYIDGIWNKENPEEWLTEIQAPIRKK